MHLLHVATASASEVEYLVTLAGRLELIATDLSDELIRDYAMLSAALRALTRSLETLRT